MGHDQGWTRQPDRYRGRFVDRFGETEVTCETDGSALALSFRGLTFATEGNSNIEWLTLKGDPAVAAGRAVVDRQGGLRDGVLQVGVPIDAVVGADVRAAVLEMSVTFSDDESQLGFVLQLDIDGDIDGDVYGPVSASVEFEGALDRLRTTLPPAVRLRMCGTCLLSSNGIFNNDAFGRSCHRDTPVEALTARWTGNTKTGWPAATEQVVDFHVCPQWIPSEVRTWLPSRTNETGR